MQIFDLDPGVKTLVTPQKLLQAKIDSDKIRIKYILHHYNSINHSAKMTKGEGVRGGSKIFSRF